MYFLTLPTNGLSPNMTLPFLRACTGRVNTGDKKRVAWAAFILG